MIKKINGKLQVVSVTPRIKGLNRKARRALVFGGSYRRLRKKYVELAEAVNGVLDGEKVPEVPRHGGKKMTGEYSELLKLAKSL